MRSKDIAALDREGLFEWHQEKTILDVTELMCETMQAEGMSRSQLAEALGKTRGYITQLLDGQTNMTLRTISDVFVTLGYEFKASSTPIGHKGQHLTFEWQIEFSDVELPRASTSIQLEAPSSH